MYIRLFNFRALKSTYVHTYYTIITFNSADVQMVACNYPIYGRNSSGDACLVGGAVIVNASSKLETIRSSIDFYSTTSYTDVVVCMHSRIS